MSLRKGRDREKYYEVRAVGRRAGGGGGIEGEGEEYASLAVDTTRRVFRCTRNGARTRLIGRLRCRSSQRWTLSQDAHVAPILLRLAEAKFILVSRDTTVVRERSLSLSHTLANVYESLHLSLERSASNVPHEYTWFFSRDSFQRVRSVSILLRAGRCTPSGSATVAQRRPASFPFRLVSSSKRFELRAPSSELSVPDERREGKPRGNMERILIRIYERERGRKRERSFALVRSTVKVGDALKASWLRGSPMVAMLEKMMHVRERVRIATRSFNISLSLLLSRSMHMPRSLLPTLESTLLPRSLVRSPSGRLYPGPGWSQGRK